MILGIVAAGYVILFLLIIWRPPIAMAPVICMFGLEQWLMAQFCFFPGTRFACKSCDWCSRTRWPHIQLVEGREDCLLLAACGLVDSCVARLLCN